MPTERELQALKILWEQGPVSVREICRALQGRGENLAYTTVLSLMQVMEQKGLVGHRAQGKAYVYFARAQRERTLRTLAGSFLENVFDGALEAYVLHALEARRLSPSELKRLEELVAKAKEQARRKGE
jgi:predicted transcriptional regulator